jgi:ribonucleoside-diphosphate reductase alpha chain
MPHAEPATVPTVENLPAQDISLEVLQEKYAKGEERSAEAVHARVARARSPRPKRRQARGQWEARFAQALRDGFVPAGRIQSAAGTGLSATLINCFVQPVGDSIAQLDDGPPRHLHRAHRGRRNDASRRRRRATTSRASARAAPGSAALAAAPPGR